jgi:hypothetical protein
VFSSETLGAISGPVRNKDWATAVSHRVIESHFSFRATENFIARQKIDRSVSEEEWLGNMKFDIIRLAQY